jgi:short-subunit dehydrogenase
MKQGFIVLTGASTGIGKATALDLDQRGYTVFAGVRKQQDAEDLKKLGSERLKPIILDVTKQEDIDSTFEMVKDVCGTKGLLALVNNAGYNYNSAFEYTEEDKARQMMEVNFFGLYKMSQKFIPLLRIYSQNNKQSSKLINIGSIGSTLGLAWESFYHASKFAVLGLSESLRHELRKQNIKVTAVLPGGIVTDFFPKTEAGLREAIEKMDDEGRKHYQKGLMTLKNSAQTALKLASKPEKVARKIAKVIASNNPGLQYLVGLDAKIMYSIVRILPISWRHALLRGQMGA